MEKQQEPKLYKISNDFIEWVNATLGQRKYAEVKVAMMLLEKPVLEEAELNHILSEMGKHSYNEVFRFFTGLGELIQQVDKNGAPVDVQETDKKDEETP